MLNASLILVFSWYGGNKPISPPKPAPLPQAAASERDNQALFILRTRFKIVRRFYSLDCLNMSVSDDEMPSLDGDDDGPPPLDEEDDGPPPLDGDDDGPPPLDDSGDGVVEEEEDKPLTSMGIDLGTTYSCVGVWKVYNLLKVFLNFSAPTELSGSCPKTGRHSGNHR